MVARRIHIVISDLVTPANGSLFACLYAGTDFAAANTAYQAAITDNGATYTYARLYQFPQERKRASTATFAITLTGNAHATLAGTATRVVPGGKVTVTVTPGTGYHLVSWTVNGSSVAKVGTTNVLTVTNILADTTVAAVIAVD